VPPRFQRLVLDAYTGEKQILKLANADHADPLQEQEEAHYFDALRWLRAKMTPANNQAPSRAARQ
jgi:hypothetical protein